MTIEKHLSLQESRLRAASEWAPSPAAWMLLRVVEGEGYLLKRGATRQFGAGDLLLLHRQWAAIIRASALGPVKLEHYCIHPEWLGGLLTLNEVQRFQEGTPGGAGGPVVFPAGGALARKFAGATQWPLPDSSVARCRRAQLWLEAMVELEPRSAGPKTPETLPLRERFRRLLGQISAEELCNRSLGELADQLGCSERHFHRLFREQFGVPLRNHQTTLRLARARRFLAESDAKIINVAEQSGYNHLGLFNQMFKKQFGMTPGDWRRKVRNQSGKVSKSTLTGKILTLFLMSILLGGKLAAQTNTPPRQEPAAAPSPGTNAAPLKFEVRQYNVEGNTILDPRLIDSLFAPATGKEIGFQQINQSILALQKEYRARGLVTVLVTLPQQKLTNATIKVKVVESPLSAINIVGNRYFNSNNVMRKLPSLRTNELLNSFVLQRELDAANASRDRQIYTVLGPGPDPDTSALTLRVKDQLPLHARLELDNYNTPGSPALRANFNAQYDNLWNLDHQAGVQYSFTPEFMKYHAEDEHLFLDSPEIANYSAYYRMPIGGQKAVQKQIDANPSQFGYSEATHQFQAPSVVTAPELTFYASRATTDSGVQYGPIMQVVTNNPLLNINSQTTGENTTVNNNIGARFAFPIDTADGFKFTLNGGVDYKEFHMSSFNTNNFQEAVTFTNNTGSVTSNFLVSAGQPDRRASVNYLPLNAGVDVVAPDKWGASFLSFSANFNVLPAASGDADFANASYSPKARADYFALKLNYNREQKIYGDWQVSFRAGGQWSPDPLISNEQFPLGGMSSVRGYHEGEIYGDSGWAVSLEPRTPPFKIAEIGDGQPLPCLVRCSTFFDYGQAYLSAPSGTTSHFELCGAGVAGTLNIGDHLGAQLSLACPFISTALTHAGSPRVNFSLSAQF